MFPGMKFNMFRCTKYVSGSPANPQHSLHPVLSAAPLMIYFLFLLISDWQRSMPAKEHPPILPLVLRFIAYTLSTTWRVRISGSAQSLPSPDRHVIYLTWHEHILPMARHFRNRNVAAIASGNRDGMLLSNVLTAWGFTVINGSSSRGGMAAIREAIRELGGGRSLIITPDGPRGPRREAKPGAAQISRLSGKSVVPVSFHPRSAVRLKSWDRFLIPLPFTRLEIRFGEALCMEPDESIESFTARLSAILNKDYPSHA